MSTSTDKAPLDFTKPIQTRDGRPVRILCTDAVHGVPNQPVLAIVPSHSDKPKAEVLSFDLSGHFLLSRDSDPVDLFNVEVPEEPAPKISPDKQYRTNNGHAVRILCTDADVVRGSTRYPVVAEIAVCEGNKRVKLFTETGKSMTFSSLELVEVKPKPVKISGYVNIYRDCDGALCTGIAIHSSTLAAELAAASNVSRNKPIACLPVNGVEGEGL